MKNTEKTSLEDWRLSKVKEYGREAFLPFVDLLFRYQDALVPYLRSLSKGLNAGTENLLMERSPSIDHDRLVSEFFLEASKGIDELIRVLESKDIKKMGRILKTMADQGPSLAFSTSYVAGLFIGRLSKHIIGEKKASKRSSSEVQGPPLEGDIQ